jgi:hypothetical protein
VIKLEKALESAREIFREYLADRHVPDDVGPRLGVGAHLDGVDWIVTVVLHRPGAIESSKGLVEDLIVPGPDLVAVIRVDGQTGRASLERWVLPIWQPQPRN